MSSIWRNGKRSALREWHLTASTPQEIDRATLGYHHEETIASQIVRRLGQELHHGLTHHIFDIGGLHPMSVDEHSTNSLEDFGSRNAVWSEPPARRDQGQQPPERFLILPDSIPAVQPILDTKAEKLRESVPAHRCYAVLVTPRRMRVRPERERSNAMIPCLKRLGRWSPALIFAASSTLLAQNVDIPLRNWTVPPYQVGATSSGGITTMTDITQGIGFVGVTPCRLVDTRQAGFPAGYGTPALVAGVQRNFDLNSDPLCTGIPASVDAYSLNVTVTNTAGPGFIIIWPQGQTPPSTSSINYVAAQTIANAVIVPSDPSGTGGVSVVAGVSGTDLIIDINGYFTDAYNSNVQFVVSGNVSAQGAIAGTNSSSVANSYGVRGQVSGTGAGSAGVYGLASGASGATYGVFGKTSSTSTNSAGVKGVDSAGELSTVVAAARSGVRGDSSSGVGVFGFSRATGVAGSLLDAFTPANVLAAGYLGYSAGTYGVYALGDIGATGMKFFVEPHPSDPSKVIRYVALEGPEAGIYFRGSGRTVDGSAVIEVPESFRIVTDDAGLTVQLTPVGALVQIAVVSKALDQIVVRSSRDVDFDYEVKGFRRAFRRHEPIADGTEFIPASADATLPVYLSDEARRRLISNGTYREDGSVNLTTAERLGWTRAWIWSQGTPPNRQ